MDKIKRIVAKDNLGESILDARIGDRWNNLTIVEINQSTTNPTVFEFDEDTEILTEESIDDAVCTRSFCIKFIDDNGVEYRITNQTSKQQEPPLMIAEKDGVFLKCVQASERLAPLARAVDFEIFP